MPTYAYRCPPASEALNRGLRSCGVHPGVSDVARARRDRIEGRARSVGAMALVEAPEARQRAAGGFSGSFAGVLGQRTALSCCCWRTCGEHSHRSSPRSPPTVAVTPRAPDQLTWRGAQAKLWDHSGPHGRGAQKLATCFPSRATKKHPWTKTQTFAPSRACV